MTNGSKSDSGPDLNAVTRALASRHRWPARALEKIRLPADWRSAVETGRLLLVSPFEKRPRRPTIDSAQRRNEIVAALSDEVLIIHAELGGSIERISKLIDAWHIPRR